MLAFKHAEDIHQLPNTHPVYQTLRELVRLCIESIDDYDPDIYGKVYLIEPEDVSKPLPDICDQWTLYDVQREGVTLKDGHFTCVYLGSGDYGLLFVVPALIIARSNTEYSGRQSTPLKEWQERRVGVPLEVQTDRGKSRYPMPLPLLTLVQNDAQRQSMISWIAPIIGRQWHRRSTLGGVNARPRRAPVWRAERWPQPCPIAHSVSPKTRPGRTACAWSRSTRSRASSCSSRRAMSARRRPGHRRSRVDSRG